MLGFGPAGTSTQSAASGHGAGRGRNAVQEVIDQAVAVLRQHRFRVELHPVHRVPGVLDGHDLAVLGRRQDLEIGRNGGRRDHERVVSGRAERRGQAVKDAGAGVVDHRGLAVHGLTGSNDLAAVGGPDALVSQTHSQDRYRGAETADDLGGDPRLGGRAGTRGNDDVGGRHRFHVVDAQGVVPEDHRRLPELTDVARQVVDERVVVVEQEDHEPASAPINPRALSRVSRYSSSGSESATIPPPAWKYTRPRSAR